MLNKRAELASIVQLNNPDIICVTEFLPKNYRYPVQSSEMEIDNYKCFTNINKLSCHRGVLIYVKECLNAVEVDATLNEKESVWCEVIFHKQKLLIGGIYRSPNSSAENDLLINKEIVKKVHDNNKTNNIIIMGDFNYPDINWADNQSPLPNSTKSSLFIEATQDSFLHQHVYQPTHYRSDQTPTTIDLIFTTERNMVNDISHLAPLGKSHHHVLKFDVFTESNSVSPMYRNLYSRGKYDNMRNEIRNINWNSIKTMNVEDGWKFFQNTLDKLIKNHIPKKNINNRKKAVWMNKTALAKVKRKQKAYQRYLETKEGKDYLKYTQARNQAKSECRKSVKLFEKELAKNIKKNPKAFYAYAKSKMKTKEHIPDLKVDNKPDASTSFAKAEVLNNYFSSVFTKENLVNIPSFTFPRSIPPISDLIDFSITNVLKKLQKLKLNKSPGPDGLHPRVLYELADLIAEPLSFIFKKVFEEGVLPQTWKDALITPLFKKGSKACVGNYRPISLTCIVVKVYENIMRDHILSHFVKNHLFSSCQHGFLPGRSCVTNLLAVLNVWTDALDKGINVDNIYLDFSKAFDTVPHTRLLEKLKGYGITGKILSWIENFLFGRRQCVVINGISSDWCNVDSGVPQGSVLGPILFLIYINDLPDLIKSTVLLFADDTKLYNLLNNENSTVQLQNDLDLLTDWAEMWQMRFNHDKCKVIHLGATNENTAYNMFDSEVVEKVPLETTVCERDLGVHVDRELKFSMHTSIQVNKANKITGLIRRSYEYLDKDSFRNLFSTLVRPLLEYCNSVYNPRLIQDKTSIENVLRRASKLVAGLSELSYGDRLLAINIPSMQYRFLRGDMIEVYKWAHSLYDCNLELFEFDENCVTRGHPYKIKKKFCRLEMRKHFFSMRSVDNWNKLPTDIVTATSLNNFKNKLDKHWADKMFLYTN